jgi:hypothetical protein
LTTKLQWHQRTDESTNAYARFRAYLDEGPDRSLASVARLFGVSREAIRQTAMRFSWPARAEAYDSSCSSTEDLPAAMEPVMTRHYQGLDNEYLQLLEQFRLEAERLGKSQVRLSRGFTQIASKNAARILASEKPLTVREISQLATTAAALASSGLATWGRAIGVERVLDQVRQNVSAAAQVEVID